MALISLTGCEGCFYNLIDERVLGLLEKYDVELVNWRFLGIRKSDEYDIAIVEGSVINENDLKKLQLIRKKSKILVAIGTCAIHGGVQAGIRHEIEKHESKPLASYVKVDYYIRGCPVRVEEFLRFLEDVLRGEKPVWYERRFDLVERPVFKVSDSDGFLILDSSKCIICGRCIELCRIMQANVLNYINRGISTLVSTPYGDRFDSAGCHYCGLCVAYCPVGAITHKLEIDKLTNGKGLEIYIEPEALASLIEAEDSDLLQIIKALYVLGYDKIIVYSNAVQVQPGKIYAKSPVEYQFLKRTYPDLEVELLVPKIPGNAIYVTQCMAWRRLLKNAVTSRELQILMKSIPKETLSIKSGEQPKQPIINLNPGTNIKYINNPRELEDMVDKALDQALIYTMCPGGCLMGGGQPLSKNGSWRSIYEARSMILKRLDTSFT
ncbi:MAG: 4Fe-4S binding protein [Desulfurococcaceae archaeon]